MMRKVIQDYLKSEKLPDIGYVIVKNEILLPYVERLESCLKGQKFGNKLAVANHDLPNYYTAYRILPDKRTKPIRVLNQTVVYRVGTCIISLISGKIVVYPKGGLIVEIGPDNPGNREAAYILGLTYRGDTND